MQIRTATFVCLTVLAVACSPRKTPAPIYDMKLQGRSAGTAIVNPGDSLSILAKRYALTVDDMIRMNQLAGDMIHPGQRIALPPPRDYTVRAGDTVTRIAGMFDIEPLALAHENNLQPPYALQTGQVVSIPSGQQRRIEVVRNQPIHQPYTIRAPQPEDKPEIAVERRAPVVARRQSEFSVPTQGKVASTYGPKADGLYNEGINIAAPKGSSVSAAADGEIVYAGKDLEGYGNMVLMKHKDNYFTVYGHLDKINAVEGTVVKRGVSIGTVGKSGNVAEPQLHFEIRKGTQSLNPQDYL